MANNSRRWSAAIEDILPHEEAWLRAALDWDDKAKGPPPPGWTVDDGEPRLDFEWSLHDGTFTVYSEESGDLDAAVNFVQWFIREQRQDLIFTVSWADTCDKMRAGEFGGGAVVVTARSTKWIDTDTWLENEVQKLRTRRARKG